MHEESWLFKEVFWKLKQPLCKIFLLSLDFLKAKNNNIPISNASGQILIIQKGIALKRNRAGRDRKQDLTCLCQILGKSDQESQNSTSDQNHGSGEHNSSDNLPARSCLSVLIQTG